MDPGDFSNTSDIRLALSRVITWTSDPKSTDIRKVKTVIYTVKYADLHLYLIIWIIATLNLELLENIKWWIIAEISEKS